MKTLNISKNAFKKLQQFMIDKRLSNTEANFYLFYEKDKWNTDPKLIKFLFHTSGPVYSNKLFTINELIDNREMINIPELILPEKLAIVDGNIIGHTIPYIENTNFSLILDDYSITNKEKLEMFRQIGNILEQMKGVREKTVLNDFFLNDLHEGNFILNKETNKINVIDLDSAKISGNKPFEAKYLTPKSPISTMPKKYIQNQDLRFPGFIISDENSDYYCYIIMVLNFLYKGNIRELTIDKFYTYLNYLRSLGLSYELLDKFSKIYEYVNNENIKDYLDLISDDIIHKSRKLVFEKHTKKL